MDQSFIATHVVDFAWAANSFFVAPALLRRIQVLPDGNWYVTPTSGGLPALSMSLRSLGRVPEGPPTRAASVALASKEFIILLTSFLAASGTPYLQKRS